MRFHSILAEGDRPAGDAVREPECFRDLHLDQVVEAILSRHREHDLAPFYRDGPVDLPTIAYRQEVMRDLMREAVLRAVGEFSSRMRAMRGCLAAVDNRSYPREKKRWFLEAVATYGDAVEGLLAALGGAVPASAGLRSLREYLADYAGSEGFRALRRETAGLKARLGSVRYALLIDGDTIVVRPPGEEPDYSAEVEAVFAKFRQGATRDFRCAFPPHSGLNHVDAMVLDRVATLHPEVFAALDDFFARNGGYLDRTVEAFDREVHFYVAYLEHLRALQGAGLAFCFPRVSAEGKGARCEDAFDLALAGRLVRAGAEVVRNGFALDGPERILVVTGPNQGGKTTFARMFGQLHWLAGLGLPVPGSEVELPAFDRILAHFERVEQAASLRGKLQDDLLRIHGIVRAATPRSVIIVNEIFASTSAKDALDLSRKVLEEVGAIGCLCVCVTFLDELSRLSEKTASYVAGVRPDDPTVRTFRIERRPADGRAYALAIAEKYGLTYERMRPRIKP